MFLIKTLNSSFSIFWNKGKEKVKVWFKINDVTYRGWHFYLISTLLFLDASAGNDQWCIWLTETCSVNLPRHLYVGSLLMCFKERCHQVTGCSVFLLSEKVMMYFLSLLTFYLQDLLFQLKLKRTYTSLLHLLLHCLLLNDSMEWYRRPLFHTDRE